MLLAISCFRPLITAHAGATRSSAEGQHLSTVIADSDQKVGGEIVQEDQARRRQSGPIELKHRDNTPVVEPTVSPTGTQPSGSQ